MAGVLSSPLPSLPSSSAPLVTPPLLGSPILAPGDALPILSPPSPASTSSGNASEPSTPTGMHHSLVPAYPYNVAMVPAAVNGGPLPDDSEVTTRLPSICVDYLSHDWAEDDVWTSWKAMTRHKAEIANGVRLENASWRTWAKQRGNLKTVSPETLNWLKDSDVTWLYGPLHTAVEAVPPPREATAGERLGLEPLRSLSDVKAMKAEKDKENKVVSPVKIRKDAPVAAAAAGAGQSLLQRRHSTKAGFKTKPILKYRSLSDMLLPQNQPTSPMVEQLGMDFEDQATISVHHARSDSHLVRFNSLNRKGSRRGSPLHSPGSSSPERTGSDSSSAAGTFFNKAQKKRDHRHISFNHRVEQCIAIDSAEEKSYSTAPSSSDEDDDDVLTFGARSPRHNSFIRQLPKVEPHTIARLGPTTLKSVELYPAPSPAVVFSSDPDEEYDDAASTPPDTSFGEHVEDYTTAGREQQQAGQQAMYDYSAQTMRSQWDPEDDDDYAMGFDYFTGSTGPEGGMGDEYDMAQYGSTHLVGGSHNNYRGGSVDDSSSSSYLAHGPYSPTSPYNPSVDAPIDPAGSQPQSPAEPSPASSTSPASPSSASRGPYSPTTAQAVPPKRSAMKGGRSRESSAESAPQFPSSSTASSSSLATSTSPPRGISAIATAIPPHVRPANQRNNSSDDGSGLQERGRSASRGSSSSLEREASANRRSSSSISPNSSYSPPVSAAGSGFQLGASGTYGSPATSSSTSPSNAAAAAAQPITIQPRGMGRNGSYDSLSSVMSGSSRGTGGGSGFLPDVPESISESPASDAGTVRIPNANSGSGSDPSTSLGRIVTSSSVDSMGSLGSFGQGQTPTSPMSAGFPSPSRSGSSKPPPVDDDDDDAMVEDVGSAFPTAHDDAKMKQEKVQRERTRKEKEELEAEQKRKEGGVRSTDAADAPKTSDRPPPLSTSSASSASSASPSSASFASHSSTSTNADPRVNLGHARNPSAARLRNASPSTSVSEDGHGLPSSPAVAKTAAVPSPPIATSSTSPPSSPGALGAAGQSGEDDLSLKRTSSASSYARRSLLRAARGSSSSRERPTLENDRRASSASEPDYAHDDDALGGAAGGVGRGLDVAGTARDLLGALSKGIWGSLGGSGNGQAGQSGRSAK
ncbi:hypothetical protein JCM11641_006183 [Rhodosporidiobolus odoratus]